MKEIPVSLTKKETIQGFAYLVFWLLFLPAILAYVLGILPVSLGLAEVNVLYYGINFAAVLLIFRKFLLQNVDVAAARPGFLARAVLFGMARYMVFSSLMGILVMYLAPDFVNANDTTIDGMVDENLFLMALGTIVLVPPVEECLFRGLIFRNLYDKSKLLAYLVSTICFAFVHLVGYLGDYTPVELLAAFLQYVPAGLCLGWAYVRGGTIFAPILIHAIVNAMGIYAMR